MSAWATRALDVALGGGAEDACEDACERDALVGERAGWVSDAGGGEFDEERGATRGAATRGAATTRTAGVVAVMVGVVGCAAYALYSTTGGGSTAGVARLGGGR